jgi:hypothetical protein
VSGFFEVKNKIPAGVTFDYFKGNEYRLLLTVGNEFFP